MIKRKKSISLALALFSAVSLSGCSSVTSNSNGEILTYTYDGENFSIRTDQIIERYLNQSRNDHAAALFNALDEVVIRMAFQPDGVLASYASTVDATANEQVEKAKDEADTNGQTWEDYLKSQVTGDDLTVEEMEKEFYLTKQYDAMKDTVEDQYFRTFSNYNRADAEDSEMQDEYNLLYGTNGYIQKKVPYHVRHILIQVDASDDYGYSRGHISSDNAHKIYQVFQSLINGNSFASTANSFTDDTGNQGDNGVLNGGEYIMDNDTSFVNEFKLGVYTYDLLLSNNNYASDSTYEEKRSNLHIPESVETDLTDFGVTFIPYGVVQELEKVKDITTTANGQSVYGGDEDYFPRNIYFNKYFQNRNVAFVTDEALYDYSSVNENNVQTDGHMQPTFVDNVSGRTIYTDIDSTGHYDTNASATATGLEGNTFFKPFTFKIEGEEVTKNILCDTNGNPIMVVRNQESSSGIHLIVIERSPFDTTASASDPTKATIEEYYAPVSPKDQNGINPDTKRPYWSSAFPSYTADDNGKSITLPKQTYVQTEKVTLDSDVDNTVENYVTRVSSLRTSIKGAIDTYDTYEWLNPDGKYKLNNIAGKNVQDMVDKYIEKEKRATEDSSAQTLEDSWVSYLNAINEQTRQRRYNLLPEVLAAKFGETWIYQQGMPGYNPSYDDITAVGGTTNGNN